MIFLRSATLAALIAIPPSSWATPILIQEVLYDASGPDAPFAFTELVGPPGASIDGWSLVGVNGATGTPYRTLDLTGSWIPLDGIFVIATASASIELAAERDLIGNVDCQNGPDRARARDPHPSRRQCYRGFAPKRCAIVPSARRTSMNTGSSCSSRPGLSPNVST